MEILNLPHNVHIEIISRLTIKEKFNLSFTNKLMFNTIIPLIYSTVVYLPIDKKEIIKKNYDFIDLKSDNYTVLTPGNILKFFQNLEVPSLLNFEYSNLIQELYLDDLTNVDHFDISQWRKDHSNLKFSNLKEYQFSNSLKIEPFTFNECPNLQTLIVDLNFCLKVDSLNGFINFVDYTKVKYLHINGKLGVNEDIVIFKILKSFPNMIKNLLELHFHIDETETYDRVYRRLVGFLAILRKMGLVLHNVTKLSIPLTNHSTAVIIGLINKHIHFEHLTSLEILIEDDGGVLNLINSTQHLSLIVKSKGFNIKDLSINYKLIKSDNEKNHLRSLLLLRLLEPFKNLKKLSMNLDIEGLNFSNLVMIIGTPISNNLLSLRDIKININNPSENLVGNLITNLDDIEFLFPDLNYLHNCKCDICSNIINLNEFQSNQDESIKNDSIRVSTLMIIGTELDQLQNDFNVVKYYNNYKSYLRFYKRKLINSNHLFDHLISMQLNKSLKSLPNLKIFEICGLVYHNINGQFELLYGDTYKGLNKEFIDAMIDMGNVFSGDFENIRGVAQ